MRRLLLIFMCLSICSLFGCEHKEALENATFNVEGKDYRITITEVEKPDTDNVKTPKSYEKGTVLPPSTKYAIVTPKGVYLTNTVLYRYPNIITIVNYSVKEDGVWVFYEKTLNLHKEKHGPIKVEQQKM